MVSRLLACLFQSLALLVATVALAACETQAPAPVGDASISAKSDVQKTDVFEGDMTVSDAIGGPYSCATACANFAKFNCPAEPTGADCVEGCSSAFSQLPPGCAAKLQTFLECLSTASLFCSASGELDGANCKNESWAFAKCAQGYIGPPVGNCAPITCSDCLIDNVRGQFGCGTTCGSSIIEFKCSVKSCKCSFNGATFEFPRPDGVCANNPGAAMLNLCFASPPPP